MAGFSTKTIYDWDKEYCLDEWASNTGSGLMGLAGGDLPPDCYQFCLDQYKRFNIKTIDDMEEIINTGGGAAMYFVDIYNPYVLLHGISDVDASDEWSRVTYQIFDVTSPGKKSYEPSPEHVESFVFMPGQAEEFFNHAYAHPGLSGVPHGLGEDIRMFLDGSYYGESALQMLSHVGYNRLCELAGGSESTMYAYLELAAWATFIWIAGPLSRPLRMHCHDIMSEAIAYGECIMVDGSVISPKFYNKLDRPPMSCNKCGVQVWCVEPTLVLSHSSYICEKCLNFDMPPSRFSNCGSKFCSFSSCPNHPYHHLGKGGMMRSYREKGQLAAAARGEIFPKIMGKDPNLKRLGI